MFITGVTTGHFIFPFLYYVNKQLLRTCNKNNTGEPEPRYKKKKKKLECLPSILPPIIFLREMYMYILISKSGEITIKD